MCLKIEGRALVGSSINLYHVLHHSNVFAPCPGEWMAVWSQLRWPRQLLSYRQERKMKSLEKHPNILVMSNFSSFFDSRESRNLENEKKWLENSRDSVKSCFFHNPSYIQVDFLRLEKKGISRIKSSSKFRWSSFQEMKFWQKKAKYA